MSQIVKSLDRYQEERESQKKALEEESAPRELFSRLGILLWLGASITATVFSYHLGVKQGTQNAKAESPKQWLSYFSDFPARSANPKTVPDTQAVKVEPLQPPAQEIKNQNAIPVAAVEKSPEPVPSGFAIQLVTYSSQKLAEEEVKRLTQKGHKAFLIRSGKYYQVFLDRFETKKLANRTLSQIQKDTAYKNYSGAYVRFLKR